MTNTQKPDKQEYSLYQDLCIDFDPDEMSWTDETHQAASEIEKRVLVKNGSQPLAECQVVLQELAYRFRNEWTDPPNGYEQKALKWAEASDAQDGRIEIASNIPAKLAIVKMYRFPNPYFGITYGDGSLGKTHHFTGAYRLRLRLEGKIGNRGSRRLFVPCIYEVYLRYVGALELKIEDIIRISTG